MQIPGQIKKNQILDNITIVLVEPQQSLNIGSVARAMKNLGFVNLILVNPKKYDRQKATITARWASDILERARIFEDLKVALNEFSDIIGFGGRYDQNRLENISLPEWKGNYSISSKHKTALVFGPEDRGLNTEELTNCRFLVRIPSTAEYPSYNLAQAVLLALYQIASDTWDASENMQEEREMPTRNEFYHMERLLSDVLHKCGFHRPTTPQHSPGIIKRLFIRMNPDKQEMGILLAMINRIDKALSSEKSEIHLNDISVQEDKNVSDLNQFKS